MAEPTPAEILDNVRKRLEKLRAEAEALQTFLETYNPIVGEPETDSRAEQESLFGRNSRQDRRDRLNRTVSAARHLMLNEGRPMKRGELVQKLLAQGYEIDGTDKNKVFGTNLWRSGRFVTVDGEGYWPNDVPVPHRPE